MADTGKLHQIAIANYILCQHNQVITALFLGGIGIIKRAVNHIHLIANNRLDTRLSA